MMVSAVYKIKRFKFCREDRASIAQGICKGSRKHKANCFIFHSHIADLAHYQVHFILVSGYTIRYIIITDDDDDHDSNYNDITVAQKTKEENRR